jgi:hypothetical protein
MRTSIRYMRLTIALVIAAIGLSIFGIGAALAGPGKPSKPVKVHVIHGRASKDRGADRASRAERSDSMRG